MIIIDSVARITPIPLRLLFPSHRAQLLFLSYLVIHTYYYLLILYKKFYSYLVGY